VILNMLNVQVKGLRKAIRHLGKNRAKKLSALNQSIHNAGFLLEGEVKNSIAGRKAEPRSVDTGQFMNSVSTDNSKRFQSRVFTAVKHGRYLEYGTSRIKPRRHFQNSGYRLKPKIIKNIQSALT